MVDAYARGGFDFLMVSEHDALTGEREYAELDAKGLVLIPGNEITANGPHVLHVNADRLVAPVAERQEVINAIAAGRGLAVAAHPNWERTFDHCPIDSLRQWSGYAGIEIYNATIADKPGSPFATGKWDMLLSDGRRVWGFANDDYHRPADAGLGFNAIFAEDRSPDRIVAAVSAGRFYASSGVVISEIVVDRMRIRIATANACRISASMQWGCRFVAAEAKVLEIEVPDGATYVRFTCWGEGEQFAWTQPFFVLGPDIS